MEPLAPSSLLQSKSSKRRTQAKRIAALEARVLRAEGWIDELTALLDHQQKAIDALVLGKHPVDRLAELGVLDELCGRLDREPSPIAAGSLF